MQSDTGVNFKFYLVKAQNQIFKVCLGHARVALLQAGEQVTDDPIFQHDALLFIVVHDPHNTGEIAVDARCSFQFRCAVAASKKSSRGTIIFDPPFTVQASQRFWLDIDEKQEFRALCLRAPAHSS